MTALSLPTPLVDVAWLAAHLHSDGLVVLDASMGPSRGGARAIPGAITFDLDGDLSAGGPLPHTLPGAAHLSAQYERLGLHPTSPVVVYDADGIYSSARAWWMLRLSGLQSVAVLDGGLPAWLEAGHPTGERAEAPGGGTLRAQVDEDLVLDADATAAALADQRTVVLDARSRGRFAGTDPEPRPGLRPGHMPGSVNLPFTELQREGRMLPPAQLARRFDAVADADAPLVMSCGSGVTACVLALGAQLAGRQAMHVYDGSWSEWGRPAGDGVEVERPVETGP